MMPVYGSICTLSGDISGTAYRVGLQKGLGCSYVSLFEDVIDGRPADPHLLGDMSNG